MNTDPFLQKCNEVLRKLVKYHIIYSNDDFGISCQ